MTNEEHKKRAVWREEAIRRLVAKIVGILLTLPSGEGTEMQKAKAILALRELAILDLDQTPPKSSPSGWPLTTKQLREAGWCRVLRKEVSCGNG